MKFTCSVSDFREGYTTASYCLDKLKNATVSKMLFIQAMKGKERGVVYLFSFDGTASSLYKINAVVEEAGTALVEPKEMGKTLPTLEDDAELEFELKNGRLQFKCGNFKPKCALGDPSMLAEKFKGLPLKIKADMEVPAWQLRDVMERTIMFASKGDTGAAKTQPFLKNVHLRINQSTLESFSTNNNVLAKACVQLDAKYVPEKPFKVDIPSTAVPALMRILSNPKFKASAEDNVPTVKVTIEMDGTVQKRMFVRTDEIFYSTALAAERIPEKALQSETNMSRSIVTSVQLNREDLTAVTRRCEPFIPSYGSALGLKLQLKDNVVTFFDRDGDELDKLAGTGKSTGEAAGILDLTYVGGVLGASKEQIVTVSFIKSSAAILFASGADTNGRSFYVVGCMRDPVPAKKEEPAPAAPAESTAQAS